MTTAELPDLYFGAMSPYSWLAAERIEELLGPVRWRPVFAGGLFEACGRLSWGLTDDRASGIAACEARAAERGLGPIVWPEPWPTLDLTIARAMVFADQSGAVRTLGMTAMRMAFTEGADLGDDAVVAEAVRRCGMDPVATLVAARSVPIKTATRTATEAAIAAGVSGVPTVVVAGGLFWGDDRLEDVVAAAGGGPV